MTLLWGIWLVFFCYWRIIPFSSMEGGKPRGLELSESATPGCVQLYNFEKLQLACQWSDPRDDIKELRLPSAGNGISNVTTL